MNKKFFYEILRNLDYKKASKLSALRKLIDKQANMFWFSNPIARDEQATKETFLNLAEKAKTEKYHEIDDLEKQMGYSVDEAWYHNLALHTQIVIKNSPLCYVHGRVLYSVLRKYIDNNNFDKNNCLTIWETGTARGFSSLCMAKALSDHNIFGRIITFDVLPHHTKIYWNCIDDFDGKKSRSELLSEWNFLVKNYIIFHQGDTRIEMPKVKAERIHFSFLDGAHTYEDVMFEFYQICDHQKKGDIILFDDYTPHQFPGIVKAVNEICEKHGYKGNFLTSNQNRGYVITEKQ